MKRSAKKAVLKATSRRIDAQPAQRVPRKKKSSPRAHLLSLDEIVWGSTASLTGFIDRHGYRFGVVVQHILPDWHMIGLVTASPELGSTIDSVLSHHAHQNLGVFGVLDGDQGALAAARKFLLEAPVPGDACSCDEVAYTPYGPDP